MEVRCRSEASSVSCYGNYCKDSTSTDLVIISSVQLAVEFQGLVVIALAAATSQRHIVSKWIDLWL